MFTSSRDRTSENEGPCPNDSMNATSVQKARTAGVGGASSTAIPSSISAKNTRSGSVSPRSTSLSARTRSRSKKRSTESPRPRTADHRAYSGTATTHVLDCWLEGFRFRVYLDSTTGDSGIWMPDDSTPYGRIVVGASGARHLGDIFERLSHEVFETVATLFHTSFKHDHLFSGAGSDGRIFIMRHDQMTDIIRSFSNTVAFAWEKVKVAWLNQQKETERG